MTIAERKQREAAGKRELVLKTALRLFLDEGFEKVSLRRIAERIEYSPAAIYRYFKDKSEILYALQAQGFEKFFERQQTILVEKDPLRRLRRHAKAYLSFALENPEYYDLMFIMRGPIKKMKEKKEWKVGMRSYEFLRTNVEECMEAGCLPKANADVAAFAFWSLTHGMASLIIRERCMMFPRARLRAIIDGALDFVMAGITGKRR